MCLRVRVCSGGVRARIEAKTEEEGEIVVGEIGGCENESIGCG